MAARTGMLLKRMIMRKENGCNVGERTKKEKDMLTVISPPPKLHVVQVLSLFFHIFLCCGLMLK